MTAPSLPNGAASKVAYVVKRYPRYSETFIVNEILAHEAAGLDIEVFSLLPPVDTHFQDPISRVRAPVRYLPSAHQASSFWQALREAGSTVPGIWPRLASVADSDARTLHQALALAVAAVTRGVTHLHAHFASGATSVARLASLLTGIPYTFTAHAKDIFHESVDAGDLARKLADASATVTISDFNLRYLCDAHGADPAKIERIYNGLPLDEFEFSPPTQRPRLIVAVGRLVEKKGYRYLIEACAELRARGQSFACEIIGAGEEQSELELLVRRLGLGGAVKLLGPLPQREVKERVKRAAAFAAPCVVGSDGNQDGLPTVLLEAMALGTPCVSTDVTGIPEVLEDETTGLLVPQRDPRSLADALQRLLDDPALRYRLALRARRLIEQQFDAHSNAARQRALFGVSTPSPALVG